MNEASQRMADAIEALEAAWGPLDPGEPIDRLMLDAIVAAAMYQIEQLDMPQPAGRLREADVN